MVAREKSIEREEVMVATKRRSRKPVVRNTVSTVTSRDDRPQTGSITLER